MISKTSSSMLHKSTVSIFSAVLIIFAVCLAARPNTACADESSGVITYNQENVAVLAQTTWLAAEAADGMLSVTVAADQWSRTAADSPRTFVAFARGGTRLDVKDARLGSIVESDAGEMFIMRKESASASANGTSIVFTGKNLVPDDFNLAYSQIPTV